jgi:hypothetical protein
MAMFCGHASPAIVAAVVAQAARFTQFLLPTPASVEVAEELARRYPVPKWQFTLSATQANTEVIRLARAVTGRDVVVLFQGHYHGHFDEGLVDLQDGPGHRPAARAAARRHRRVRIAQFNDTGTLRRALEPGDAALVLTEPALTNNIHLLLPEPGWHGELRTLTRQYGTLLAVDETHTHVVGPGGATAMWQLRPDMVTIGKAAAGGLPMGAYGVTAELGSQLEARDIATGGTLAGQPRCLGGTARRRADGPRPGGPRRRGPVRRGLQRAAGPAALTSAAGYPGRRVHGAAVQQNKRQIRAHASVSTARRICSISLKCSWPQISGGDSWITGSPRSSARQTSPASNRACDRKPRSSRSDSSSVNVSRVALSRTSSMP